MYSDLDVIVAQATAPNITAPVALVRVSGAGCWPMAKACFKSTAMTEVVEPWHMYYGRWLDELGEVDDVMAIFYAAPVSYTGQDMVEVFCHGSQVFVDAIVASLMKLGARRARPGEFTSRAFINGKMDLVKAESLHALVEASTRFEADLIRKQAKGPLVKHVKRIVEELLNIQAHIEAAIDYGEEDLDAMDAAGLLDRLFEVLHTLRRLAQTAQFTGGMQRGFKVLLTGEPNAGKSTLFNTLVKQERAIVTPLPGTTRDLVSEQVEIKGLPVVLIDSAGVRDTADEIEQLGIQKIFEQLEQVDLVLFLTMNTEEEPYEQVLALGKEKWIKVVTKCDQGIATAPGPLAVSAQTGFGLDQLEQEIVIRLSAAAEGNQVFLINQRQAEATQQAIALLEQAKQEFEQGYGEEILSSYLNSARYVLGEITGETTVEDILDRMFANFCLGK